MDESPVDAVRLRQQHRRERDREQVDGERPDQVHQPREPRVDEPSEETGHDSHERTEQARDDGRADADLERGAPAVENARGHVAPLVVGAEEVVAVPGRPDRHLAELELAAARLQDWDLFAVDQRRSRQVRHERVGLRDVLRVVRRREADRDDDDEERESGDGDLVAQEPAQGEGSGAPADDLAGGSPGHERSRRLRLVGDGHVVTAPTPGRAGSTTAG